MLLRYLILRVCLQVQAIAVHLCMFETKPRDFLRGISSVNVICVIQNVYFTVNVCCDVKLTEWFVSPLPIFSICCQTLRVSYLVED